MSMAGSSLRDMAIAIVEAADPFDKVELAHKASEAWQAGKLAPLRVSSPACFPDHPGRPEQPQLLPPGQMPRRRPGSKKGLIALVHSLVHIELSAIDMTWDLIARFVDAPLPEAFLDEAVKVGLDEARHFAMINTRLQELGACYGDLPAHAGLWEAAQNTGHDLLARLAIVPLVLEARGLDVSPMMIRQVKKAGAMDVAAAMQIIYEDEITHVAFGARWFKHLCRRDNMRPEPLFHELVRKHFRGGLKPPFNDEARAVAGLTPGFYQPLVTGNINQM